MGKSLSLLASAVLLLLATASYATTLEYHEDFTNSAFEDTINTSAEWDTLGGALHLFPFAPRREGQFTIKGYCGTVASSGNFAFMGAHATFFVIDISDPKHPTYVANLPEHVWRTFIKGHYAYATLSKSGFLIIDISDPKRPAVVGTYDTLGPAYNMEIAGNYAFIALNASFEVVDISDPANPVHVNTYYLQKQGVVNDITLYGNLALLATTDLGLQVVDVSDLAHPVFVGSYQDRRDYYAIALSGNRIILDREIVDFSNPTDMFRLGRFNSWGLVSQIAVFGDIVLTANDIDDLYLFDISYPYAPSLAGYYGTRGDVRGVTLWGNYALVPNDVDDGLTSIRIAEATPLTKVGSYLPTGRAYAIAVEGDYAFMTATTAGFQVIDYFDPRHPRFVTRLNLPSFALGMDIAGSYAYVAGALAGLQIIDISKPQNPVVASSVPTPDYVRDVAVEGQYAFVAGAASGLQVVNVSDPTTPIIVGSCDTPGTEYSIAIGGGYAYVAASGAGLQVIDIADPLHPVIVGNYDTPDLAYGVALFGNYALIAAREAGVLVLDVSDPASPVLKGSYDTEGEAYSIQISGKRAYVADGMGGLVVLDLSQPENPKLEESYVTGKRIQGLAISGIYLLVGNGDSEMQLLQRSQMEFDMIRNRGRSWVIDAASDTITQVRVNSTQTQGVTWELSADGGKNWQGVFADGMWNRMNAAGTDLMWRTTHAWTQPGVNPTVSDLRIDWRVQAASIASLVDVPDDQGGWAWLTIKRSGLDFTNELAHPVTGYWIHHRIDDSALQKRVLQEGVRLDLAAHTKMAGDFVGFEGLRTFEDRTFIYSEAKTTSKFPPGLWEIVGSVPAMQQDEYVVRIPTPADSAPSGPAWANFVVSTHTTTPSFWFVSEPESVSTVDNIAPSAPTGFIVVYDTNNGNWLSWDACPDADFKNFKVYRSKEFEFDPSPETLAHSLSETSWADETHHELNVYYRVTAVDSTGNESAASEPTVVATGSEPGLSTRYVLYSNVPNPFNPSTTIRYDVPAGGGSVALRVYDLSGSLVRTLVDTWQLGGQKTVSWDGTDSRGRRVASGVYTYRLEAQDFSDTKKMILLK